MKRINQYVWITSSQSGCDKEDNRRVCRSGAKGGLEGYSPPSEHSSPPSKGEKRFFRRFLAFIVP